VVVAVALIAVSGAFVAWARVRLNPDRLWNEAQAALGSGNLRAAESDLAWIRRIRAPTTHDRFLEAQVAIAQGRTDRALDALGHVPTGDPLEAQASLLAGRLERERKRLRLAEAYFRRALAADPGLVDAHKELIYILGFQARRREVDDEFRALSRLTHLTHHDLFTWALTHFTEWRSDIANDLTAFVEADPDDRNSRLALADVLSGQAGSLAALEQVLAGIPESDPDAMAARARGLLMSGRLEDAEAVLARGPAEHPGLDRLRGKLAILRHDTGAAVAYYRSALSPEPFDRVSNFDLGQALVLNGDRAAAEPFLARARRLDLVYELVNRVRNPDRENQTPDLCKLAAACEAAGLTEEALHWYRLAIDRDPLDGVAQQGFQRVKRGKPRP
jgi:tetratricopeptide (TPR) repeat protein